MACRLQWEAEKRRSSKVYWTDQVHHYNSPYFTNSSRPLSKT